MVLRYLTCLHADSSLEHYYCKYLLMTKEAEASCIKYKRLDNIAFIDVL